jgi:transposase
VLKRSSKSKGGQYPTAFKIKAIKRVERGEGVLPVARDLGVTRKALHDWVKVWKVNGPDGLNRKRGPKPGRKKLRLAVLDRPQESRNADRDRIAELERVIGRQQLELDFFRQALRALDGTATQGKQHGKPHRASLRSSKP